MHDHRPDTHPFVIDVRELGRRAGAMRRVERTVPAPADLTSMGATVPAGSDLELDLRLESVIEGVLVSGTATAQVRAECSRCLDPVHDEITVELTELYAYPDSATAQTTGDDEVPRLAGDTIDLAPLVHDELVLAMPTAPVCSPDCRGLCPECGEPWDVLGDDHRHEKMDPRWAALAGLVHAEPVAVSRAGRVTNRVGDEVPKKSTGEPACDIEEK